MTAAITDSLIVDHILWNAKSPATRGDILHLAKSGHRKVLNVQEAHLAEFRWQWEGKESVWADVVAFMQTMTRATSWYMFFPVVRSIWKAYDMPCYPRVGSVKTITTNTVGNPHGCTVAAHGWATGDRIYISGATGADAALINGIVHTITYTGVNTFTLDGVNTTGKTINNDGSAALYSFGIRGKTTSTEVVKIAGTTKTLTTHYSVTQSYGANGESVIRFTAGNGPTDGQAVTCAFTGRRRYLVWFADNTIPDELRLSFEDGEYCILAPFNVNEDVEDD